jgi:hypothetical protein
LHTLNNTHYATEKKYSNFIYNKKDLAGSIVCIDHWAAGELLNQ